MLRLVKVSSLLIILLSVVLAGSIGMNILTYVRLTAEQPIAKMYFEQVEDDIFTAHMVSDDAGVSGSYKIYGDQWRIDAEFIKLKPWANIIGMDARYQLVRFEGRYSDTDRQNTGPYLAYDLAVGDMPDLIGYLREWDVVIDAEYGSSTFTEIKEDVIYTVYRTQSGIIVRSEPMPDPIGYEPTMLDDIQSWVSGK